MTSAAELLRDIEERTKAIWLDEPDDIRRLRLGISDGGAGTHGQIFSTLLFVQSELRGLTVNACHALLICADDPLFSLEVLKKSAQVHLSGRAGLLNYMGAHEFGTLFSRFLALLPAIESRDEFVSLLRALKTYGVRLHMWSLHIFPWNLGAHMHQIGAGEARQLLAEATRGPWSPIEYSLE